MTEEMKILIDENRKLNEQLTELEEYTERLQTEYSRLMEDYRYYRGKENMQKERIFAR